MKKICWLLLVFGILMMFGLALPQPGLASGVTYFSDNFESGLAKWEVSGLDWAIIDTDYRSSSHCITDSPSGNYPANTTATITMKNWVNLSSSTAPILSFWHKTYIDNSTRNDPGGVWDHRDWGNVDISQNGGITWINNIARYTGYAATWTKVMLDLSAYKATQVLIRFRMSENPGSGQADGWYIDDVEIKEKDTATLAFPFFDNFESGLGNWVTSGHDWAVINTDSRSGAHAITDSPDGNYPANTTAAIELVHPIDLMAATTPVLSFWFKSSIDNSMENDPGGVWDHRDYGNVDISQNGGVTWTTIASYTGYVTTWTKVTLDLTTYKATPMLIRFRMSENPGSGQADGWYIDDVAIRDNAAPLYLYANFTGYGLYKHDGASWSYLHAFNPATDKMAAGRNLYAFFSGYGLYKYDGASWSYLNPNNPTSMTAGSNFYGYFSGYGLYKHDGTDWTYLHAFNSATDKMAAGINLYGYFNSVGLYQYDGANWTYLHPSNPERMTAGTTLYASFGGYGLWKYDGTTWTYLHASNPTSMTAGSNLYAFFSSYGLYKYSGTAWSYLHPSNPDSMTAGSILDASFSGAALWQYNNGWAYLHPSNPASMVGGE